MRAESVIWHDLECGRYEADLGFWRRLVARHGDPVLDIGAGTGRVALALAGDGHAVVALERDAALAAELARRAAGLAVEVRCEDACDFALATPVPTCIVPMQTIHLLRDRAAFLRCARAALADGGVLAVALLGDGVEPFELELDADAVVLDAVRYESAPTALRRHGGAVVIERRRSRIDGGARRSEIDRISLCECDAATLTAEARAFGFEPLDVRTIAPTPEHAGSEVLCLEARR